MPANEKKLIVLQLVGANDPLNTLVPYGNGLYYDYRAAETRSIMAAEMLSS